MLDLLEQFAIIAEEPADALLDDERLQDADGEMRLAHSNRSGKQQAVALGGRGISVDEAARHEMSGGKRRIGSRESGLISYRKSNARNGEVCAPVPINAVTRSSCRQSQGSAAERPSGWRTIRIPIPSHLGQG